MKRQPLLSPLFAAFLLSIHAPVLAQHFNAEPGYLVTHQGDTLTGWIKGRTDLHEKVLFKAENGPDYEEYTPARVASFRYPGGSYKTMEIPAGENQRQQLFLLSLAEGNLSLYQYKDVYYVEKAGQPLTRLEKKDVLVEKDFNQYKQVDNRYKGHLNYLMADCPAMQGRIEKTEFEAGNLTSLVNRYNQCANPGGKPVVANGKPGSALRVGVRLGGLSSNAAFFTEGYNVRTYEFESQTGYTGGLFVILAHRNQITVQPELLLTHKGASYRREVLASRYEERGELTQTYLQVPISVYYTLPTRKVRPFISAGGFFGYTLSGKVSRTTYDLRTGAEDSRSEVTLDRGDFGYRGGTGLLYQINSKRAVGLEYYYERNLVDRSVIQQKIRFQSHVLSLRVTL